jgi:trehalose-phosphatase
LPLAAGLPARLASQYKIDLFLDYDGTISEITPDISNAQPVAGARELIERLAGNPDRFRVVLVSGRQAEKLVRLLGVSRGITFVGNHGLETIEPGESCRMTVDPGLILPALEAVREWLRTNVPYGMGFVIEDKQFTVALHYRLADPSPALAVRLRLREFVRTQTPALETRDGKMVIEAVPVQANKGEAVRRLMRENREERFPVYFGDDVTDEDAFFALRYTGVTVKVGGQPCPSWARYRVASPREVTLALGEMASALEGATV